MKRTHTSFDKPRLVESKVGLNAGLGAGLNDKTLCVTLYNRDRCPLFKVYLIKYSNNGPYDIIKYEVLNSSIRVIKDDMSNHCKSYVLKKLMGVDIDKCETSYYCVENSIIIGVLYKNMLNNMITVESKLSYYWLTEQMRECRYHTSSSQEAISDVLLCLDMCRADSIPDLISPNNEKLLSFDLKYL
jgi:hypothetical protein